MEPATLVDPLAAIDAAGEGKFEFAHGNSVPAPPQSHHIDQSRFFTTLLKSFCQERNAGFVVGDGFAPRLDSGTVRVPDSDGRLHASVLPGFWIRVDWLWNPPPLVAAQRELGLL